MTSTPKLRSKSNVNTTSIRKGQFMEEDYREVIQSWKDWHRELAQYLPVKYIEQSATLQAVKDMAEQHAELLAACEHGARSEHHPACRGRNNSGHGCTCHVEKCCVAVAKSKPKSKE